MKQIRTPVLFIASLMCVLCGANKSAIAAGNPLIIQPSQGPGWVAPKSAAEKADQQRFLTEAYARQQAQQESQNISQQQAILKIYSKDPWRIINNATNYVGNDGWQQFQGKVQAIEPFGILFQGNYGKVLSINTETDKEGSTTTQGDVSSVSVTNKQSGMRSTAQTTHITKIQHEKLYGDNFFMVVNFPYPAQEGNGFEQMMAYDCGYISYTNSNNRVLTVRKLDYGVPCIKIWSEQEIADAYAQAEAEQQRIEAEQKAQRDLVAARAVAERERLLAEQKEKLAAIEAEKKAKIDKLVKGYQADADKGEPFALKRMGEFYRDGYGVEKDLDKANEYFKKADDANAALEKKRSEEEALKEKAAKQQKFNFNMGLAEQGQINSIIFVGKCYRDGEGVEKDLNKAREYFRKATDMGNKEAAQLLLDIKPSP